MSGIEDYALIGDCETAALVGLDGSIDWLCLPRFDSDSVFAKLLGDENNGCWLIRPDEQHSACRRYRPGSLILETTFRTASGRVRLTDFMPPKVNGSKIVRIVEGLEGTVEMCTELVARFDYGVTVPWKMFPRGPSTRTGVAHAAAAEMSSASVARTVAAISSRGRKFANASSFLERRSFVPRRQVFWLGRGFPVTRADQLAFPTLSSQWLPFGTPVGRPHSGGTAPDLHRLPFSARGARS